MIPLTVDVPMKRLPWANWGLILVTLVLSIAVPAIHEDATVSDPIRPGDNRMVIKFRHTLSPLVLQRAHPAAYQPVTALFQHADLLHMLGNMLFLFVFGNAINAKLRHLGFLAAYLGIGTLANLVWLVAGPGEACLGASAAIMGLCGMFLVLYPRNCVRVFWDDLPIAWASRSWITEIPGWVVVLLYLTFDVWGAIFDRKAGIGYISHIVGLLLGTGLAVALLNSGWLRPDLGEQTLLQWLSGQGPVEHEETRRVGRRKRPGSVLRGDGTCDRSVQPGQ